MGTWLAIAGIGVATDNLSVACAAGGLVGLHAMRKWLLATGLVLVIQIQSLILGWLVGRIMDGWFGSVAHWMAIGFILSMGLRILFEATSSGRIPRHLVLTSRSILDASLGTAIYTFIYGQSANMLHATLPGSVELVSIATAFCIVTGPILVERYRIVWLVQLAGGLIICSSAVFLFMRELGSAV